MIRSKTLTLALLLGFASLTTIPAGSAAEGDKPVMPLTIDGTAAGATEIVLGEETLAAIPASAFETETPWTEGKTRFEGVRLSDLLAHYEIEAEEVEATALNDYSVTLPAQDENGYDPLIAYKVDGEIISVRDKGPYWVVYPFDANAALSSENYYSRSIWQLVRLTVR